MEPITSKIPGNRYSEFGRIYEDTTADALCEHLTKIKGAQKANMRGNIRYVREVNRLTRAIAQADYRSVWVR
jgi:hypothetical protein